MPLHAPVGATENEDILAGLRGRPRGAVRISSRGGEDIVVWWKGGDGRRGNDGSNGNTGNDGNDGSNGNNGSNGNYEGQPLPLRGCGTLQNTECQTCAWHSENMYGLCRISTPDRRFYLVGNGRYHLPPRRASARLSYSFTPLRLDTWSAMKSGSPLYIA